MRSGRFLATAAAAMMAAVPAIAAPVSTAAPSSVTSNPAASLSLSNAVRTGSVSQHDSQIVGFPVIYLVLIVVGVGVGIAGAAGAFGSSK